MPTLNFTPNLLRHVPVSSAQLDGTTVGEVLEQYFRMNPQVRGYVLDDQGAVRKHVVNTHLPPITCVRFENR